MVQFFFGYVVELLCVGQVGIGLGDVGGQVQVGGLCFNGGGVCIVYGGFLGGVFVVLQVYVVVEVEGDLVVVGVMVIDFVVCY